MNVHGPSAGVGVLFNPALAGFVEHHSDAVDFYSVIPERFWVDHGRGAAPRFAPLPHEVGLLERLAARKPVTAHGIGLSIASASLFDLDYVAQLKDWKRRYGFAWVSEHLAAMRLAGGAGSDHHAGLALPLPWDEELLALLCPRIARVQEALGGPIALENGVEYTPVPHAELSEPAFLNALTARTGCGILLDLHNLHVNERNLGRPARGFIDALDLDTVVEIHIAGGSSLHGIYLDAHSGPCPPEVFALLRQVAPRCRNLRGVTFEFLESYFPSMGEEGVLEQIELAREALRPPEHPPCPSPNSSAHSAT
ncbi:DUF692 domain-containing protein [Frateuria defendens]|uniref:DUF692 domain-containing protein n=1 Tax=Frateuria defendens TaxID=2219559 RepID=UPI00066FE94D|nr:DUF692 family multinuclear iron-containing protein [Frateuria defendens]